MIPPTVQIANYKQINDKNPYTIYHLKITTEFSSYIIFRRFAQFLDLQKDVHIRLN